MVNNSGAITRVYHYSAFGMELTPDVSDTNPFRFAGEYWDAETQTYYLRARRFNPRTGRFTQPDPHWGIHNMIWGDNPRTVHQPPSLFAGNNIAPVSLGASGNQWFNQSALMPDVWSILQSGNLFVFGLNNPVMFLDPSGRFVITVSSLAGGKPKPTICPDGGPKARTSAPGGKVRSRGGRGSNVGGGAPGSNRTTTPTNPKQTQTGSSNITPVNPKKVTARYLQTRDINPHYIKYDVLGSKAKVSNYDIFVDRNGDLWIQRRGSDIWIPTDANIDDSW